MNCRLGSANQSLRRAAATQAIAQVAQVASHSDPLTPGPADEALAPAKFMSDSSTTTAGGKAGKKATSKRAKNDILAELKKMNDRFDQGFDKIDQGFDKIDRRFDKIDQGFDKIDRRFDKIDKTMTAGFDSIDRRFDSIDKTMTARFDKIDQRLGKIDPAGRMPHVYKSVFGNVDGPAYFDGVSSTWTAVKYGDGDGARYFGIGAAHCGFYFAPNEQSKSQLHPVCIPREMAPMVKGTVLFPKGLTQADQCHLVKHDVVLIELDSTKMGEMINHAVPVPPEPPAALAAMPTVIGFTLSVTVVGGRPMWCPKDCLHAQRYAETMGFLETSGEPGCSGALVYGLGANVAEPTPLGTYFGLYSGNHPKARAPGVIVPLPRDLDVLACLQLEPAAVGPVPIEVSIGKDKSNVTLTLQKDAGTEYSYCEGEYTYVLMTCDTNNAPPLICGAKVCGSLGCGRPI